MIFEGIISVPVNDLQLKNAEEPIEVRFEGKFNTPDQLEQLLKQELSITVTVVGICTPLSEVQPLKHDW